MAGRAAISATEKGSAVAVTAYILIQAAVGAAADVARETSALSQVVTAEVAMGPYDVIARASAADMDELGGVVVNTIGKIEGVEAPCSARSSTSDQRSYSERSGVSMSASDPSMSDVARPASSSSKFTRWP